MDIREQQLLIGRSSLGARRPITSSHCPRRYLLRRAFSLTKTSLTNTNLLYWAASCVIAAVVVLPPREVQTTINYISGDSNSNEAPYNYVESLPEGKPNTDIKENPRIIIIHDIRGKEDTVGSDKTVFQCVRHVSEERRFPDEEAIEAKYYKEVE